MSFHANIYVECGNCGASIDVSGCEFKNGDVHITIKTDNKGDCFHCNELEGQQS